MAEPSGRDGWVFCPRCGDITTCHSRRTRYAIELSGERIAAATRVWHCKHCKKFFAETEDDRFIFGSQYAADVHRAAHELFDKTWSLLAASAAILYGYGLRVPVSSMDHIIKGEHAAKTWVRKGPRSGGRLAERGAP